MLDAQGAHVAGVEADNAKLHSELTQAHQALTEAESTRNSLSASWDEIEQECAKLRANVDGLKK
jgi:hypothetical protein